MISTCYHILSQGTFLTKGSLLLQGKHITNIKSPCKANVGRAMSSNLPRMSGRTDRDVVVSHDVQRRSGEYLVCERQAFHTFLLRKISGTRKIAHLRARKEIAGIVQCYASYGNGIQKCRGWARLTRLRSSMKHQFHQYKFILIIEHMRLRKLRFHPRKVCGSICGRGVLR